jgi:hypothetical protein
MSILKTEIKVIALQRSGHFAIINWILERFNDPKVKILHVDPNTGMRVPATKKKEQFKTNNQSLNTDLNLLLLDFQQINLRNYGKTRLFRPDGCTIWPAAKSFEIQNQHVVLTLRDPYNLMASRFKWFRKAPFGVHKEVLGWHKDYLRQALGKEKIVADPMIYINFNKWFVDQNYRAELVELLGCDNKSTAPLLMVPNNGNGSSFNGVKFNGKGDQMKVLERYKEFANNKNYRKLFQDKEIVELTEEFFGMKKPF